MSKVSGVVEAVKSFPAGGATMYSLVVNGNRYGCGSREPKCKAGDTVSFTVTQKGQYLNVDNNSLVVEASAATAVASLSKGGFAPDRQEVISKQAALNTAIAFANLICQADALPGTTAKMSAQDKYNIIEALVDQKAREFFSFSTGGDLPEPETKSPASPGTAASPKTPAEWA